MGFVAGGGGGGGGEQRDPFPVDALVNDILVQLRRADGQCTARTGQDRVCCEVMVGCIADFKSDMEKVFSLDVDAQNIHRACRNTTLAYAKARACLSLVECHKRADREGILAGFMDVMDDVREKKDKHCQDLPPERTTTKIPSTSTFTRRPVTPTPVHTTPAPSPSTDPDNHSSTTPNTSIPTIPTLSKPPTTQVSTATQPPTTQTPPSKSSRVTLKHTTTTTTTKPIKTSVTTQNTIETQSTTNPTTTPSKPPTNPTTPPVSVSKSPQSTPSYTTLVASSPDPAQTKPPENTGSTDGEPGDTTYSGKDRTTGVHGKTTSNNGHGGDSSTPFLTDSTTDSPQSMVNGSITGNGDVTSLPNNSDIAVIVGAAIGGLLLILAFLIVITIKWRRWRKEQDGSNGSVSSKKPFLWSLFESFKTNAADTGDTEIYAEIDEAFMDAVYKVDQDKPPNKRKNRPSTNSQVNICYEAGLDDNDAIISAARTARMRKTNPASEETFIDGFTRQNHGDKTLTASKLNELNNISEKDNQTRKCITRNNQDEITSFQNGGYDADRTRVDNGRNPKGYMLSRPSFTDIRHKGNTYEDIPPSSGDYVEINEPIYEEPMRDNQTYDSANYGGFRDKPRRDPEPNYSHIHVYKKTDMVDEGHANTDELDDVFYQNLDSMMEY